MKKNEGVDVGVGKIFSCVAYRLMPSV